MLEAVLEHPDVISGRLDAVCAHRRRERLPDGAREGAFDGGREAWKSYLCPPTATKLIGCFPDVACSVEVKKHFDWVNAQPQSAQPPY